MAKSNKPIVWGPFAAGGTLTAFLTPKGEVFFGGTYFPPDGRYGRPGFRSILATVLFGRTWAAVGFDPDSAGAMGIPVRRANLTAALTSPAPVQRAIRSGYRSIDPFQTLRCSS